MSATTNNVTVIVPTRNAMAYAHQQVAALRAQSLQPARVIILDSESSDGSPDVYAAAGYSVLPVRAGDFDHGSTRNIGLRQSQTDFVVFLTHDSVPKYADALENLLRPLIDDPSILLVYGRQVARGHATAIETHGRLFNYPDVSKRDSRDAATLNIRTIFHSNVFAAYRRQPMLDMGGFRENIILGEDIEFAGRALLSGWAKYYAHDAVTEHSHSYNMAQEFRRYFDIGVMHAHAHDLFAQFPKVGSEGNKFVLSELAYLMRHKPLRIPEATLRSAVKLFGYHIGKRERRLPLRMKRRLAMNSVYFG